MIDRGIVRQLGQIAQAALHFALVTHGLTIRALIGIVPNQAKIVVLKPTPGSESGPHVVGRIAAPN